MDKQFSQCKWALQCQLGSWRAWTRAGRDRERMVISRAATHEQEHPPILGLVFPLLSPADSASPTAADCRRSADTCWSSSCRLPSDRALDKTSCKQTTGAETPNVSFHCREVPELGYRHAPVTRSLGLKHLTRQDQ